MPLGSGVKTNIMTGEPLEPDDRAAKQEQAEKKLSEAISRSMALQAEINGPGGLVVEAMIEHMILHASTVLERDPVYASFLAVLKKLNLDIVMAPRVVERHLKMVLPSYQRPAAPSGIPADEQ